MLRLFRQPETAPLRPPATWSSRLFGVARFSVLALAAAVFMPGGSEQPVEAADPVSTAPATSPATVVGDGIPAEVVEALKSLRSNKPDDRAKAYAVLSEKADARILPAINSFFRGELHLRNADGKVDKKGDRLAAYGATYDVPGGGKALPVLDALTGEPLNGPDGQPVIQSNRPDLGSAFTKPLNAIQQKPVLELRAFLSLLHPDEEIRKASIREAGERAARVFPDPEAEEQFRTALRAYNDKYKPGGVELIDDPKFKENEHALAVAIEAALAEKPKAMFEYSPTKDAATKVSRAVSPLVTAVKAVKGANDKPSLWPTEGRPTNPRVLALSLLADSTSRYLELVDAPEKALEELPRTNEALRKQLSTDPSGPFAKTYEEAIAQMDVVLGDENTRLAAIPKLGDFGTARAANILRKLSVAANRLGDEKIAAAVEPALAKADAYQRIVRVAQYTFAGLSSASIYVLLALGLAIIFGLMGVINMAHGEFMMVGAFSTYVVASWFKTSFPGAYDYFPILAVPAAFVVAGLIGLAVEYLVIRHLYGRTTETLVATIGVGIILVQLARTLFGDNLSVSAPKWMQGSAEVAPDLLLNRARVWTIAYCVICVLVVYLIVNKTKLGLLLRATTQNRKMAAALGVPTRGVDALTFAFGAGLAGMAGVTIPMIDKIKPAMGGDYVIMSFMVVVVGGVGKIAGAIIAGIGLGSIGNYLEPALSSVQALAKTSTVVSKVLVLAAIVAFLQKRPSGLFPPKGRVADA